MAPTIIDGGTIASPVGTNDVEVEAFLSCLGAVEVCAGLGLGGSKVYDALLLECARHSQADRIYTFNLGDFRRLAPDLAGRMAAP